ncbi:MAG: hypothetical protein WC551_06680 [Patescibacteria group bacterium]
MEEENRKRVEDEFERIRAELDSPEGQAKAEVRVRAELRKAAEEHRAFLARSRANARNRVIYR